MPFLPLIIKQFLPHYFLSWLSVVSFIAMVSLIIIYNLLFHYTLFYCASLCGTWQILYVYKWMVCGNPA